MSVEALFPGSPEARKPGCRKTKGDCAQHGPSLVRCDASEGDHHADGQAHRGTRGDGLPTSTSSPPERARARGTGNHAGTVPTPPEPSAQVWRAPGRRPPSGCAGRAAARSPRPFPATPRPRRRVPRCNGWAPTCVPDREAGPRRTRTRRTCRGVRDVRRARRERRCRSRSWAHESCTRRRWQAGTPPVGGGARCVGEFSLPPGGQAPKAHDAAPGFAPERTTRGSAAGQRKRRRDPGGDELAGRNLVGLSYACVACVVTLCLGGVDRATPVKGLTGQGRVRTVCASDHRGLAW